MMPMPYPGLSAGISAESIQPPFTKALKSSPGRTSGFMCSESSPECFGVAAAGIATVSVAVWSCPQAASTSVNAILAKVFFTMDYLSLNWVRIKIESGILTQLAGDCSRVPMF